MAGMNGKECLKLIREQKQFDAIPEIILTNSDQEADITETFQSCATLFVAKPFHTKDMVVLLKRIFAEDWQQHLVQRDRGIWRSLN
jgi:CheY-like chemotaxis protein